MGLLFRDGRHEATLAPGAYALWKGVARAKVVPVDLREQVVDVAGQVADQLSQPPQRPTRSGGSSTTSESQLEEAAAYLDSLEGRDPAPSTCLAQVVFGKFTGGYVNLLADTGIDVPVVAEVEAVA